MIPAAWAALAAVGGYVGPLMAQAMLAAGAEQQSGPAGGVLIGGALLVSSAGKPYAFGSPGAAGMWCSISSQRAAREVELSQQMDEERRVVWLWRKREALEREAARRVKAAANVGNPEIAAALIADADFALNKWAHY